MANRELCRSLISTNINANDVVEEIVNNLMLLPEAMVQEFKDTDWHIFITKGSIETHFGLREPDTADPRIMGITCWDNRVIFIPILKDSRTFAAGFATIHEFGHYFDRSNGMPSASYKFQNIYNAEDREFCNCVGTAGNTTEAVEYFAEAFASYVLRSDKLKEHCPTTYAYFDSIFDQYK